MNIRFNFWQQVCLFFLILFQASGLFAQPPVYKVTKSVKVTEDITVIGADPSAIGLKSTLALNLLNENSDAAGIISSRLEQPFRNISNAVRWGSQNTVPTLLKISDLGNDVSYVSYDTKAMNDNSSIVGIEKRYDKLLNDDFFTISNRAVVWNNIDKIPTVLGSLGFSIFEYSEANAINNNDIVVGASDLYENEINKGRRAVRWNVNDITPVNLGVLGINNNGEGNSIAVAVNNSGIIVGESKLYENNVDKGLRAVRWRPNDTEPTNLGTLGVDSNGVGESTAIAINANGVILGNSTLYEDGINKGKRAVRWAPNDTQPIMLGGLSLNNPPFSRSKSVAMVINNNGVSAGTSSLYDTEGSFPPLFTPDGSLAVYWGASDTIPLDLGTLVSAPAYKGRSPLTSEPNAINDNGTIVGNSLINGGSPLPPENKAVLWDKNGGLYDLNLLLGSSQQSEWILKDAISINNSGVILAKGTYNDVEYYAILEPEGVSNIEPANKPGLDPPCSIGVDPQTVKAGEGVTLWWWTAEEVGANYIPIINNGIGLLDSFAGNKLVYPTETTTYKMSARRKNNIVETCETTLVVEDEGKVEPTTPLCNIGADPQTIRAGERVPLWWWTQDILVFPMIDKGIGQVDSLEGYKWVYPTETTTYTMTAEADDGALATCETTIVIDGEVEPTPPLCDIGADPQTINAGNRVPLWWWYQEDDVTFANINNKIGSINNFEGYTWIEPIETTTYTLTVENEIGTQGTCETTIVVNQK